jgi:hypothetical protein
MTSTKSSRQRLRTRLGDESGQTTFFVLCSFMTFFMFFALVANVGQAVNRRVLLQMVADAGAFSGASAQATALNTIAEFNDIIDTSWDVTTVLMLGWTIQYCGVDEVITRIYQAIEIIMSTLIRVTNHGGAAWSIMEAEMVTRENIRQLFPDGSVHSPLDSFPSLLSSPGGGGLGASHIYNLNQAWPSLFSGVQLVRLKQKTATRAWTCYSYPVTFQGKSRDFNLSWEKEDDDEVTRFYWWVTADPVDVLVLPRTASMPFGFPQLPAMTAVALAKPVGGDIEPGGEGANYVARMVPLSIIDAKFLNLGGSLPSLTEVLH